MANYQEAKVNKYAMKKLKSAENQTWTILRINKKHFEDEKLPY